VVGYAIEEAFEAAGFLFHLRDAYAWRQEAYHAKPWQIAKSRHLTSPEFRMRLLQEFAERAQHIRPLDFAQWSVRPIPGMIRRPSRAGT
jgi:hypothetical protein